MRFLAIFKCGLRFLADFIFGLRFLAIFKFGLRFLVFFKCGMRYLEKQRSFETAFYFNIQSRCRHFTAIIDGFGKQFHDGEEKCMFNMEEDDNCCY